MVSFLFLSITVAKLESFRSISALTARVIIKSGLIKADAIAAKRMHVAGASCAMHFNKGS